MYYDDLDAILSGRKQPMQYDEGTMHGYMDSPVSAPAVAPPLTSGAAGLSRMTRSASRNPINSDLYSGLLSGAAGGSDAIPSIGNTFANAVADVGRNVSAMADKYYAPATISPEADGSRPYSEFNNGLTASPFMVGSNLTEYDPVHVLGYSSRHGTSMPTTDYTGVMNRNSRIRHNLEMSRLLGQQDIARSANENDLMRTMLGIQQRDEAARGREEGKFWHNLENVPEGSRTPIIQSGVSRGLIGKEISDNLLNRDILSRAKLRAKSDSGIDMARFLGSISSEFDPNKQSRADLIQKIQQMGFTANQIAEYEDDPQVGAFVKSLLNPPAQTTFKDWIGSTNPIEKKIRGRWW